jgi:hypothetical protein
MQFVKLITRFTGTDQFIDFTAWHESHTARLPVAVLTRAFAVMCTIICTINYNLTNMLGIKMYWARYAVRSDVCKKCYAHSVVGT